MAYLEAAVSPDLDDSGDQGESFITAAVLEIPDEEPVLHLVSCGHPPPLLLLSRDGRAVPSTWTIPRRRWVWPVWWNPP